MSRKDTGMPVDAVEKQHRVQAQVDSADQQRRDASESGAMQAGARRYPEPPFPEQHQAKPGDEAALDPAPMYDAPSGKGPASWRARWR